MSFLAAPLHCSGEDFLSGRGLTWRGGGRGELVVEMFILTLCSFDSASIKSSILMNWQKTCSGPILANFEAFAVNWVENVLKKSSFDTRLIRFHFIWFVNSHEFVRRHSVIPFWQFLSSLQSIGSKMLKKKSSFETRPIRFHFNWFVNLHQNVRRYFLVPFWQF